MCMSDKLFCILWNPTFNIHSSSKKRKAARNKCTAKKEMAAKQQQLPPNPPPPTQFNEIKDMLEPYWRLFNSIMENQPRNNIVFHQGTLLVKGYNIPTLGMRLASDPHLGHPDTAGIDHYPPEIQARVRMGSLKYNHCDYSIQLFLIYLEPLLREVGAKVEWFAVGAKPMVLFHSLPRPAQLYIRHSVFIITTTRSEEFIADFTIEQFGFPDAWWFMEKTAYLRLCTIGLTIKQPSAEEVARARAGEIRTPMPRDAIAFAICDSVYLDDWMTYEEEERLNHMDGVVKGEFARLERRDARAREVRCLGCRTELSSAESQSPDHGSDLQNTIWSSPSPSPSTSDAGSQSSQRSWDSDTEYVSQSIAGSPPYTKDLRRYYYGIE